MFNSHELKILRFKYFTLPKYSEIPNIVRFILHKDKIPNELDISKNISIDQFEP